MTIEWEVNPRFKTNVDDRGYVDVNDWQFPTSYARHSYRGNVPRVNASA